MKIMIVNDTLQNMGGAEKYVFNLKYLLEENGHEVMLFGSNEYETRSSFFSRWFSFKWYMKMRKAIKVFKPDIIHANGISRVISPTSIIAANKLKVPVIMTIHDFHYICPKTWGIYKDGISCNYGFSLKCLISNCKANKSGHKYIIYHWLKWSKVLLHRYLIKRYVNHFICPSMVLKKFMKISLKIPDEKVTYLPNFVNINNIKMDNSKLKTNQFLFVGRLSNEKGIDVAIQAINELVKNEKICDVKLKIAGSGPEKDNLAGMVKKLHLQKNVDFIGYIPDSELINYYNESLAVLMPSIWMENNPLAGIESMAYGKPIIGSNIGGIPELVIDGETGYLFKPKDYKDLANKMLYLLLDPKKSIQFGKNAKTYYLSNYIHYKHIKKLEYIYKTNM